VTPPQPPFRRAIVIVMDSVGIGELPDAPSYGDVGSNTVGNIHQRFPLKIPTLRKLGLDRLPHAVAMAAGYADAIMSALLGREPRIPLEGVRMARHSMFVDAGKARRELGFTPGPVSAALERAVRWYRANGYTRVGRVTGTAQAHAV